MEIKRRKIGTVYTYSPAQNLQRWLITNLSKIMFSIVSAIIWMAVFYVIVGVIRFLGVKIATWKEWETVSTWDLYITPKFMWVNMIGILIVAFFVMRDSLTRR